MTSREFDIVVWGATGFTGRMVALVLARRFGLADPNIRIALAGRSEPNLRAVTHLMLQTSEACATNPDASLIPIIVLPGYGTDPVATETMANGLAARTHVVIAAAGPYAQYGEPIVKACAVQGTDYIDCTGEYTWVKTMRDKYNSVAIENEVRILPFCGLAYLLNDVGVSALQRYASLLGSPVISQIDQQIDVKGERISHGTLKSLMGHLGKMPFYQLYMEPAAAVYDLCSSIPTSSSIVLKANGNGLFFPWYSSLSQCWMRPTPLGRGCTRYIHWTNELKNYQYGRDFIYQIGDSGKSFGGTLIRCFLMNFLMFFLKLASLSSLLTAGVFKLIAMADLRESVTSLAPFEQKGFHVTLHTRGQVRQASEQKFTRVRHTIRLEPAEAYLLTACVLVDTAVCCVNLRKKKASNPPAEKRYGFGCPSWLLGQAIEDQLKQSGFTMTFKLDSE